MRHVALVTTDTRLRALRIRLISRALVVIIEYLTCDNVYTLVPVNKVNVGLGLELPRVIWDAKLAHVARLIVRNLVDAKLVLFLGGGLPSQDRLGALESFGYVLEAAGRQTRVRLIVDRLGAENDRRLTILVRLTGWLWSWVLKKDRGRFRKD